MTSLGTDRKSVYLVTGIGILNLDQAFSPSTGQLIDTSIRVDVPDGLGERVATSPEELVEGFPLPFTDPAVESRSQELIDLGERPFEFSQLIQREQDRGNPAQQIGDPTGREVLEALSSQEHRRHRAEKGDLVPVEKGSLNEIQFCADAK